MRPCQGGVHVARLNFKTSRIGVYKCLLLIVGFAFTVAIWPREIVSCLNFILRAVTTFWAMSLVRIYPGRASTMLIFKIKRIISSEKWWLRCYFFLLKMQKFWVGGVNGVELPSAISSCPFFVPILILYLSYSPPLAPPSVPNVRSSFHYVTALSGKRTPALSLSSESSRKGSVGPPLRKYPRQDNLAL